MSKILIVGSPSKDVYLKMDERKNHFEKDANGVNWLDLSFDSSSHHFFSRLSVYGGAIVSLEVFNNFDIDAALALNSAKFEDSSLKIEQNIELYRYILCQADNISYFSPSCLDCNCWRRPESAPEILYIDRSAMLSSQLALEIEKYLLDFPQVKLYIFVNKRTNQYDKAIRNLISRANFIISDTESSVRPPDLQISSQKIILSSLDTDWSLHEKQDLMTHLTTHSIIAATIISALELGSSPEEALLLARANVQSATLKGTQSKEELMTAIAGEAYRIKRKSKKEKKMTEIQENAKKLVAYPRGILAADESGGSIHKKFESIGIEDNEESRRNYRNIFFTTPGIENYVNGVILFDETARQFADDGTNFIDFLKQKGIIAGIKVDQGLEFFENSQEKYTKGLDTLPNRLTEYYNMGARFAKWRAAFEVSTDQPSEMAIRENSKILAQYAAYCQSANIVPIVEPELVYDADYSIEKSAELTGQILQSLFEELAEKQIDLTATILKVNMVLAGKKQSMQSSPEEVAKATASVLLRYVPKDIAGVVFLSGGQGVEQATDNLRAIIKQAAFPWPLTFSFARALQDPALFSWQGDNDNINAAREAFRLRLVANSEALLH